MSHSRQPLKYHDMKTKTTAKKKTSARRTSKAVGSGPLVRLRSASESNLDQLCKLPRDNWTYGNHWLLTDGYEVTVCNQKTGEAPTGSVTMPRRAFNALVKAYTKPCRVRA